MPGLSEIASAMAYPERIDIARDVFVMRAAGALDVKDTNEPTRIELDRRRVFPWQQPLNFTPASSHRKYLADHGKVIDAQRVYEAALFPELHALATRGRCKDGDNGRLPQRASV